VRLDNPALNCWEFHYLSYFFISFFIFFCLPQVMANNPHVLFRFIHQGFKTKP